jgi:hypothetical protein
MRRRLLPAHSILVLLLGCGADPGPFAPSPAVITVADGIEYRAEVRIETRGRATAGPGLIEPTVRITNRTPQRTQVQLEGCAVRLDAHRDADRAGPPAWTSDRPSVQCMQDPYTLELRPGASEEVASAYDGALLLAQLGAPGTYHFTITLRTLPDPIVLPAGSSEITFGTDQLAYHAETRLEGVAPTELRTEVTVTNTGRKRVRLEYGACSMWLRAYRSPDRTGTPAWDAARRPNPDPVTGVYWACPMYLRVKELARGESHTPSEFQESIPVPKILGDSLPDGDYYFVARVQVNGVTSDVPAGQATLIARQDPLPSERTVGAFRYRAETRVEAGSPLTLRSAVTVTNVGDRPAVVPVARSVRCAVQLTAYRDAAAREDAYRGATPAWITQGCPVRVERVTLAAGESRTLEGSHPLPAIFGAPGGSVPEGRYYFLTLLWVEQAGSRELERVFLAAGEEDLRRPG